MTKRSASSDSAPLPAQLWQDIRDAGYYPDLVGDLVDHACAGERVVSHVVHQETTFDTTEAFRRHITVLTLTPTRLLVTHADDHPAHHFSASASVASTSVETVPLDNLKSAVLTAAVHHPEQYTRGSRPDEVTVTLCWGTMTRVDVEPAACADPECTADHGFTGQLTSDDIVVRVSAAADGVAAVDQALAFVKAVNNTLSQRGAHT